MLTLFEQYPPLKEKLAHVALGEFPTPVEKLERLGQAIHTPRLYVKHEDLSGKLYGGNKIRALDDRTVRSAHHTEEFAILATAALMVLKPF